jgi:predicted ABC-type transport system involved in lysophospholipase L1 biosynthesis ATPase subunit
MVLDLLEEHTVKVGRTLVLVTHDPALASRAACQVHLTDGRLDPPQV